MPGMSTYSTVAGVNFFGRNNSRSCTRRASGTCAMPTLVCREAENLSVACCEAVRMLNRVVLPTLGKPRMPSCIGMLLGVPAGAGVAGCGATVGHFTARAGRRRAARIAARRRPRSGLPRHFDAADTERGAADEGSERQEGEVARHARDPAQQPGEGAAQPGPGHRPDRLAPFD